MNSCHGVRDRNRAADPARLDRISVTTDDRTPCPFPLVMIIIIRTIMCEKQFSSSPKTLFILGYELSQANRARGMSWGMNWGMSWEGYELEYELGHEPGKQRATRKGRDAPVEEKMAGLRLESMNL
eukprot:gene25962-biopygen12326